MSTDTEEKSSTSKAAIEAVGSKTLKAATGDVLTFQVKSSSRPVFETSDSTPPLYAAKTPAGYWAASWVPTSADEHTVTASVGDGADVKAVVFIVTATDKEN